MIFSCKIQEMDSSGTGYSAELIRSIKTTLNLEQDFNFNGASTQVKRALMDTYLQKLQPAIYPSPTDGTTPAISGVSQGIS